MAKYKKILEKGDVFGNLIVIGVDESKKCTKDGRPKKPSRWNYWCECALDGNIISAPRESLTSKNKTSCGCDSNKHPKYLKHGMEYGMLTVDCVDEDSKTKDDGSSVWPVRWRYCIDRDWETFSRS